MFEILLNLALVFLSVSTIAYIYRVIKGPSIPDKVIALDAIGINLVGITAIISIILRSNSFLEVILLIAIVAFVGTVAFSKFLEKGVVIEHDRDA
ncbi:Na(+)/H(+) antiporter subunit F1 [Bacillus timonensis]|uniref:Na(+)/H(+) antiporter subunit F1 n=1 Tax=Bacillus timonensis TaxID=1033734 RepID=A0A4V3V798_9BACI|nr:MULTISPECIES: Na(+)/H(+) antiporter subunit F1 [Bacillus]RFB15119.1 Na(+)/H(+) antiporter subunit F1 [Bacillus sp. HNG]THE10133.1 Na(+)/H(+) antiporter subunit F1 [Bacillus timonensis]